MKKVILFDMDGTLIDSTEAIYESFCEVFRKNGHSILSKDEVKQFIGYTLQDMFRFFKVAESKINQYSLEYKEYYKTICDLKTLMLPNAVDSIKKASEFGILGVVTTKTSASTKNLLAHFGLSQYFEVIIGREDVTHTKPHKEPILNALNALNIKNKENAYMIGDTILDLQAARNAGILGIGVLCGYGKKEDLKQWSEYLFDDTLGAVNFIKTL